MDKFDKPKVKLPKNPYPDYLRFTAQREAYEYALQQVKEEREKKGFEVEK